MKRLKVLLVDDNLEFLGAAAGFLSGHGCIEIVGQAHSGWEAIELARESHPELVVMDLSMPGMNGFEATRQIKSLPSPPRVLIMTLYDGPDFFSQARAFGADGFVTKAQFGELLMPSVAELFPFCKNSLTVNGCKFEFDPAANPGHA